MKIILLSGKTHYTNNIDFTPNGMGITFIDVESNIDVYIEHKDIKSIKPLSIYSIEDIELTV